MKPRIYRRHPLNRHLERKRVAGRIRQQNLQAKMIRNHEFTDTILKIGIWGEQELQEGSDSKICMLK